MEERWRQPILNPVNVTLLNSPSQKHGDGYSGMGMLYLNGMGVEQVSVSAFFVLLTVFHPQVLIFLW